MSSTSGDSLEAIYIHRIPTSTIYSVCTSLSNIITTPQNHFRTTLSHISLFQRRLTMEHCPTNISSSVICHSQWAIWSPIPSSIWFYLSHCNTIYVGYPNALSQSRQRSSTPSSNTTSCACQKKCANPTAYSKDPTTPRVAYVCLANRRTTPPLDTGGTTLCPRPMTCLHLHK